jgi:DNA repair protein RAD7
LAKIKESKTFKRQKRYHEGEPEDDDDAIAWNLYKKKGPIPGQLENCEICEKRFTVTAYSKAGPDGGLLCAKCSKEQDAQKKQDLKPKKQPVGGDKRRQTQSNLLDGILENGAMPLLELCIKVGKTQPSRQSIL